MERIVVQSREENWLILEDFNEVLCTNKKRGPSVRSDVEPADFRRTIKNVI